MLMVVIRWTVRLKRFPTHKSFWQQIAVRFLVLSLHLSRSDYICVPPLLLSHPPARPSSTSTSDFDFPFSLCYSFLSFL